ncbi:di-heme-cytochrome C peroxidase [Xanthobacter agilis]|uniref:Mono/diheme cytochrome c family protein n=1 Tax=Xanthobacter agilis TaxID=47492 RepID=A0ABU0LFK6_XANAG|nr:di-heme-cytochrome C peroxidase [Xanthobacter agilis]MDQ0505921.1 mono/diheme cytochrome c family protein [Xanthobacter agilis]
MVGRTTWIALGGFTAVVALAALTGAVVRKEPDGAGKHTERVVHLDQGWSQTRREEFYYTPQGSQLLPYAFLKALEQPAGTGLFLDPAYVAETGYLPSEGPSELNPDGLPIGFARDPHPGGAFGPAVGLTCAACHTNDIRAGATRIRIDGGASLGDFQMLMARLSQALDATLANPAKFQRFAARLKADPKAVRPALEATATELRRVNAAGWTPTAYGRGRIDAFGHILNAVAAEALGQPANFRVPDAPVSYPFLWTTPDQRYAQWNGVAGNPIGRNLGEVLGVFGHPSIGNGTPASFTSSALVESLKALEDWAGALKPPPWPRELGRVSPSRAKRGAKLYAQYCAGCHGGPDYPLTPAADTIGGRQWLAVEMVDLATVKTDPKMLQNFATRTAQTGVLAPVFGGATVVPAGSVLLAVVGNIVENDLRNLAISGDARLAYYGWRFAPGSAKPQSGWTTSLAYKAGPLAGVWATGPFLHNGSVPTVYDLLSPPQERPRRFYVGDERYDAKKLGYVSDVDKVPEKDRAGLFLFDTTLPGNSNSGHAFPDPSVAQLSPSDRYAIIEYLKVLEGPHADGK